MKKVLVTGGAGFIGSHLVDRLLQSGDTQVLVYDNLFRGRLANLAHHRQNPRLSCEQSDLRDYPCLQAAMAGADTVFHLGAQSNVMGAVLDLDYSFTTNVAGTFNVLKAAQACGVRRVVFSSSREVYGEPARLPVDEDDPIGSKNAYGASKVAGEMYCRVFASLHNLETAVLRFANVYGPRDYGRVIPLWLERLHHGQDLVVYGGQQVIDFVWIDQVVEALLRAATYDIVGQPINVGSGCGVSIMELAQRLLAITHSAARLDVQPARSAEVVRFTASVGRMRSLFGLETPADPLFGLEQMASPLSKAG